MMQYRKKDFLITSIVGLLIVAAAATLLFLFMRSDANANKHGWKTLCAEESKPETCRINHRIVAQQEVDGTTTPIGNLLNLNVLYVQEQPSGTRVPYMSLQLPLGLDLRPGAVLRIDETEEIKLQYLQCTVNGCETSLRLSPALIDQLKRGKHIFIGVRPWGTETTTVITVSLLGFTASFEALS